jgi:putative membrane protein insertion efficiency factor
MVAARPTLGARMLLTLFGFYRRYLSGLKRMPTCRFLPTCSEYACEAVERRGALFGLLLTTGRLFRCHPFCRGGFDPVPPAKGAS